MYLKLEDIAGMIDLSCVRTTSCEDEIIELIKNAQKYKIGHVAVLQCFVPLVRKMLEHDPEIKIVGNVSFPSGSDSTSIKVAQAKELVLEGCNEIDMVINVGKLRSKSYSEVEEDIRAVVEASNKLPVKVIIETPYLTLDEIKKACEIIMNTDAAFVKTSTGWTEKGTTIDDIKAIKAIVGERVKIKASGGIRDLDTLIEMYRLGTQRFGVNLVSGKRILDDCISRGGEVVI
ncbi:MAG TPA: deoxyribose-phosphate aldolase [Ruminiclostridium sp.]